MDNLRAVIKNLFCYMSPQMILTGDVDYKDIKENTFLMLGSGYITRYSNDELSNMFTYLGNEFKWQMRKLKDEVPSELHEKDKLNVFNVLIVFGDAVLIEENGIPLCKYIELLRWRDVTTSLEEDLFITSYLAFKDSLSYRVRHNFFWKPVIGHNNHALNRLVEKGVAENHFHLKGSAPQFHLSWMSIMNQVDKKAFVEEFDVYESNRLQKKIKFNAAYQEVKLTHMWRQAALIRLFLFSVLKEDHLDLGPLYIREDYLLKATETTEDEKKLKDAFIKQKTQPEQIVDYLDYKEIISSKSFSKIQQGLIEKKVKELLDDSVQMEDNVGVIQENIDRFRDKYGKRDLDYMICEGYLARNGQLDINGPLSGERWFLYQMFQAIYRQDKQVDRYINWFYAYIVIKSNIRNELVQANSNVGFDNFEKYQDRKEHFIESDSIYEKVYLRMAVRDTIYNQHIKSLEARIMPKNTMQEDIASIQKIDRCITDELEEESKEELLEKFFYVFHFPKSSEHIKADDPLIDECRHFRKRRDVEKQAREIAKLRENGADEAVRIRGIDACAPEIWCRPEVFAQAFRYLKSHTISEDAQNYARKRSQSLLATYHVGEDFLDIIDGLRAIDEAIHFLNLRCGDRIGHGLALGVDIKEWYEGKSYRIMLNKMCYMDNLVWLYGKLRRYHITNCDHVKAYIEKRFSEYFNEIYENNMVKGKMLEIIRNAKEYFDIHKSRNGYNYDNLDFGINEYYDAWKLRGDNPELYREGFFKLQGQVLDEWDVYAVNREFPQIYQQRYNPEAAMLYHMYHYNRNVKLAGEQMVEVKIDHDMIEAIGKVRSMMQREICRIGIGIETNPSSNYLIGTFRRYDKHPITSWYNQGLTLDQSELERCPQLQVSINTDDQGVFSTYIENEYAYIALALEKCKDEYGQPMYNKTMILQWLDNVRRMGIDQSFIIIS